MHARTIRRQHCKHGTASAHTCQFEYTAHMECSLLKVPEALSPPTGAVLRLLLPYWISPQHVNGSNAGRCNAMLLIADHTFQEVNMLHYSISIMLLTGRSLPSATRHSNSSVQLALAADCGVAAALPTTGSCMHRNANTHRSIWVTSNK